MSTAYSLDLVQLQGQQALLLSPQEALLAGLRAAVSHLQADSRAQVLLWGSICARAESGAVQVLLWMR